MVVPFTLHGISSLLPTCTEALDALPTPAIASAFAQTGAGCELVQPAYNEARPCRMPPHV